MRFISALLIALIIGIGTIYFFPEYKDNTLDLLSYNRLQTLEIRYSADRIMEKNKRSLLKDSEHSFLEPKLEFHPYLLMDVKYNYKDSQTKEGVILWSLTDGEMVIDATSWDKTHGFTDCINANASKEEFKIINALAQSGGAKDKDKLLKELNVDDAKMTYLLDSCKKKSLIVQNKNSFRLHLENPKLGVCPETTLEENLVTKPVKHAKRVTKKYRTSQIENAARLAFDDSHFAIRKSREIFLPVYSIVVQNPDGSQLTTYWNALNGKQIKKNFHQP